MEYRVPDRDPDTGQFLPGNRFWEARSSHGANPKFADPQDLWQACTEYFEWNSENPLHEAKAFAYEGSVTVDFLPKMRAMTVKALCIFLDISHRVWNEWKTSRPDLIPIIENVEAIIYSQKFEGASSGLLNANIIARDLGLAEKSELTGKDGGPVAVRHDASMENLIEEAKRLGIDPTTLGLGEKD